MSVLIFPIISESDSKLPFYIKSVGVQDDQEHITRTSGHPEYHYLHSSSGEGILEIDGKEFTLNPGTGVFFEPGIPHEYYSVQRPWVTYWITFEGYAANQLCRNIFQSPWSVFHLADHHFIEQCLDKICTSTAAGELHSNAYASVLLYELLIHIKTGVINDVYSKPLLKNQLQTVIRFIEKNYNRDITLDELSHVINVSPQHLCRLFKQTFSMRPFEYITRYRLKCAKELLSLEENYSIKAIAARVGYNDTSYFCSTFKEYEGCSPTGFRNILRR